MTHVCFINNNIIIAHTSFFIQLNIIMQSLEDNQSILKIFPYFVIETHRASAILQKKNKYNIYLWIIIYNVVSPREVVLCSVIGATSSTEII